MKALELLTFSIILSFFILFNNAFAADFQATTNQAMIQFAAVSVFVVIGIVMAIIYLVYKNVESLNVKSLGVLAVGTVIVLVTMFALFSIGTTEVANSVVIVNGTIVPDPPDASFQTNATVVSGTQINLSWESTGTGTTTYSITRNGTTVVASTGNVTTYSNTGLSLGTTYTYSLTAFAGSSILSTSMITATTWNIPSAPIGFSADDINSTAIILSWASPYNGGTPITGYKIERQNNCSGAFSTIVANTGNTLTSYTNTGLANNICYNYHVAAINVVGTSANSNNDNATTLSPPPVFPPAPTSLSATTKTTSNIYLAWLAPSGPVTGYKVEKELGTNGGFGTVTLNTGNTTVHYTVTGLTSGTQYTFRVSAVNASGTGVPSATANNYTITSTPTSLAALANGTGLKIVLSWNAPSGTLTGYKIVRNATTLVANTGTTTTTYTNSGLTNNTAYNYTVAAINLGGTSAPSNTASAKVINSTTPSSNNKFLLALFLQYVAQGTQTNIYSPNMDSQDHTRLRSTGTPGSENPSGGLPGGMSQSYITAALALPGKHAAAYLSLADIINNAVAVKNAGFDIMEYNLESGTSPASDKVNITASMQSAANAAHAQGLKFRATPSKAYTTSFGSKIATFSDYYHIQAQSQQQTCGTGNDGFKSFVDTQVPILRNANHNLIISVQESTSQGAAPGKTVAQTMETCFAEVASEVNGTSIWFGGSSTGDLQTFVTWFHANYDP